MRTWPRLVGRRLHTEGVMAGNAMQRLAELVQRQRLHVPLDVGRGLRRIALGEGAELRGRHGERPGLEQQVLQSHRRLAEQELARWFSVTTLLHLVDHAHLQMVVQVLADARQVVHRPAMPCSLQQSAPGPMPESCRICGEPIAPAARITSRRASTNCLSPWPSAELDAGGALDAVARLARGRA